MDHIEARSILGVDDTASAEELKAAYRMQLMLWHPDRTAMDGMKCTDALRRTQRINAAWDTLQARRGMMGQEVETHWTGRPIRRVEHWPRVFWATVIAVLTVSTVVNVMVGS